ncbi:hypothetical protein ABK040_004697 [Willaertia magna]
MSTPPTIIDYKERAKELYQHKSYNEAIRYFERALITNEEKEYKFIYCNIGHCFLQLKHFPLAYTFYNKALMMDKKYEIAKQYKEKVLNKLKELNKNYIEFLEELSNQIENINTGREYLEDEQKMMNNSGKGNCARALQNITKFENLNKMVELIEKTRTESNENNFKEKKDEMYKELEEKYQYKKTNNREEGYKAYLYRTWC